MFDLKRWIRKKRDDVEFKPEGFTFVGSVSDLPSGKGKVVMVKGREIGLFNVGGRFFAIDNICPHNYRPIGTLEFNKNRITCLWHGFTFNVETGECVEAPHFQAKRYRVLVEEKGVFVSLQKIK